MEVPLEDLVIELLSAIEKNSRRFALSPPPAPPTDLIPPSGTINYNLIHSILTEMHAGEHPHGPYYYTMLDATTAASSSTTASPDDTTNGTPIPSQLHHKPPPFLPGSKLPLPHLGAINVADPIPPPGTINDTVFNLHLF